MVSTYSTSLRLELPADGDRSGTWGQMMNTFMGTLLEDAILGVSSVVYGSDANKTLTTASGSVDEARNYILNVTSGVSLTVTRDLIAPVAHKTYVIFNNTTGGQSIRIIGSSGTGITIPNGSKAMVYNDGTNFVDAINYLPVGSTLGGAVIVTETGTQTLTNKTLASPTITVRDNVFTIQDNADPTKQAQFELSGITAGTTRTYILPNSSGDTIIVSSAAQGLQNKTLDNTNTVTVKDTLFTVQDDGDATKQARFQASGITAGQTRTYTLPDASGSILLTDGSGASLTGIRTQGLETVYIPATAMTARTTNGAAAGTVESTTNKIMQKSLDFDPSTIEHAQFQIRMPKSWNAGTVTASFVWTANSTSTNAVVWGLQAVALGNDETIDTAFGTGVEVTDANTATAYQAHLSDDTAAITIGSTPASRNLVVFQVYRNATSGSDTLAADAMLLGLNLYYTTNAGNDA
jgi:hypothetical protein